MVTCEDCTGSKWGECCSQSPVNLHPGKTAAETGRAKRAAEFRDELRTPTRDYSARIARPGSCFRASESGPTTPLPRGRSLPAWIDARAFRALTERRMSRALNTVVAEIEACRVCAEALAHEPRPVVWVDARARILIAGQAPGRRVHESGIPWNDASGDRLREWMQLDRETFYDKRNIAVAAMGFCFPGTVNGADLPPRRECAPLWRPRLLPLLKNVQLTLLVGAYAQRYHLGAAVKPTLGETVRAWRDYPANVVPLPHPSWRNTGWLKRNPWFEQDLLPELRRRVSSALL